MFTEILGALLIPIVFGVSCRQWLRPHLREREQRRQRLALIASDDSPTISRRGVVQTLPVSIRSDFEGPIR